VHSSPPPAIPDTCTYLYSTSEVAIAIEEKPEITENVLDEAENIGVAIEDKQMIIPDIEAPFFAAEVSL
jgi:hypothetical protein